MAATVTARQGYKGILKFSGKVVHIMGDLAIDGTDRAILEKTALGDGMTPFRSVGALGMYGLVTLSGTIAYDPANEGCTAVLLSKSSSALATLSLFSQTAAAGTLLTGQAYANRVVPRIGLDGLQQLDVTFTYDGTVTGALV